MKFDYSAREVDPLPGESGPQVVFEPIVLVQCHGPARSYLIRGLLDTGASMTLLPRAYMGKLGVIPEDRSRLVTAGGAITARLATVDLELRSGRVAHRWSARVGFVPHPDNLALLGHDGFLNHFTASFDGLRRCVTLRPNGTFPDSIERISPESR